MRSKILFSVALAGLTPQAFAQQAPDSPRQVLVTGGLTDIEASRDFVAGKKIIGRKRIEESGLPTVQALLKREPSVSVSADGRIGLMGMPGYTQVLVDGAPPSGAKSLDLELVHVEKIEIIKTAVAEYGPYGIAGTINIVRRKTDRKTDSAMTLRASTNGRPSGGVSLSHHQSTVGSPLRFSGQFSASEGRTHAATTLRQTVSINDAGEQQSYAGSTRDKGQNRSVDASGDLQWQVNQTNKLSFSPSIGEMTQQGDGNETRYWTDGTTHEVRAKLDSRFTMATAPLTWTWKPDASSQLETVVRSIRIGYNTDNARIDAQGGLGTVRLRQEDNRMSSNTLLLNYKTKLSKSHSIKLGASFRSDAERTDFHYLADGAPDLTLDSLGAQRRTFRKQRRMSIQDDWRLSGSTALNLGLSGEDNAIELREASLSSRPHYRVWSPSLHLSQKIAGSNERQLRLSIARTYRAPETTDLSLRPQINALAPCSAQGICAGNSVDTADTAGNPSLQPERSLGVNVSYEHGIGEDSQFTAELFTRHIDRKIGTAIVLEHVLWSEVDRYVARPENFGKAQVRGLNLEMELALRDLLDEHSANVTLRGSASWTQSRVSILPGPDNRLDGQSPWRAKLGATHVLAGLRLKIDIDADWTAAVWTQTNFQQRIFLPKRFSIDTSARWTLRSGQTWSVNLVNLGPRRSRRIDEFLARGDQIRLYTDTRKYPKLEVRFETKL